MVGTESARFKKSNNLDIVRRSGGTLVRTFNLESGTNAYRCRIVMKGTTDGECSVTADESYSAIGWLVNDETPPAQREETRTTVFTADDEVSVASGDGYVVAYAEEAVNLGDFLVCGTGGAVKKYDYDDTCPIIAKAEESITEAGTLVVRMLM